MSILKRLIHLFVLLIVVSFSVMVYILVFGDDTPDKYAVTPSYKTHLSMLLNSDTMKVAQYVVDQ